MRVEYFYQLLKSRNGIMLTDDYVVYNDLELYNFKTEEEIHFKNYDEFLEHKFLGKTMREFIEEQEAFYDRFDGGRGASSSTKMGGGFTSAMDDGKSKEDLSKKKFPAEFNIGGKNRSQEKTLELFQKKYAGADHEYAVTVDEQGFVHRHVEGGKSAVSISGQKNQMIIHNHPSGGAFSSADLKVIAMGKEKSIVATGKLKGKTTTYTLTKTNKFKAKEFSKAVDKAQWPSNLDYNAGADWWLKRNAKKYGYKYSFTAK